MTGGHSMRDIWNRASPMKGSGFDFAVDLCRLELEAIEKEGGKDETLLRIRMDTIQGNLRIANRILRKQKESYREIRAAFEALHCSA